jgi:hypothetical protein
MYKDVLHLSFMYSFPLTGTKESYIYRLILAIIGVAFHTFGHQSIVIIITKAWYWTYKILQ